MKESYFKKSGGVSRLFDLAEQGWVRILMPEIAKREWFNHFKTATHPKFAEVEKKASIMGNTRSVNEFVISHNKLAASYDSLVKTTFEEHLNRAGVVIIPTSYANDTLELVVDRYFNREKPFGGKGKEKEFPDAFILASLEKYAKENSISLVKIFSTDDDINLYNNEVFAKEELGQYLSDFISKRIPEHEEEEKRKRDKRDIVRFMNYLKDGFFNYEKQIHDHVEMFLSNVSLYEERFNYTDIDEAYVDSVKVSCNFKNVEILSIEDDSIQALYFVNVGATVTVSHFCEEESIWDSEDKKFIYEKYDNTNVKLSSVVKIVFEMDRLESDMSQIPLISIQEIDTDDLEESINRDCRESQWIAPQSVAAVSVGSSEPSAILAMEAIKKSMDPMCAALSSMTALQTSLQQLKTPEVQKGMMQMSAINGSLAETIKSIQKMQDNFSVNVFAPLSDIIARMRLDNNVSSQINEEGE